MYNLGLSLTAFANRKNLDPVGQISNDEDLWRALEISQLKDVVSALDEGLGEWYSQSDNLCNLNKGMWHHMPICFSIVLLKRNDPPSAYILDWCSWITEIWNYN